MRTKKRKPRFPVDPSKFSGNPSTPDKMSTKILPYYEYVFNRTFSPCEKLKNLGENHENHKKTRSCESKGRR